MMSAQETHGLGFGRHLFDGDIVYFSVLNFLCVFVSLNDRKILNEQKPKVLNIKYLERTEHFLKQQENNLP